MKVMSLKTQRRRKKKENCFEVVIEVYCHMYILALLEPIPSQIILLGCCKNAYSKYYTLVQPNNRCSCALSQALREKRSKPAGFRGPQFCGPQVRGPRLSTAKRRKSEQAALLLSGPEEESAENFPSRRKFSFAPKIFLLFRRPPRL